MGGIRGPEDTLVEKYLASISSTTSTPLQVAPLPTPSFDNTNLPGKMQFSVVSLVVLAATASASFVPRQLNGTTPAYYPTGTGSVKPTGTAAPTKPTSQIPFTGAATMPTHMAGSALGLVVAGGVALVSLVTKRCSNYA